jgi:hypothetical protein
VKTIAERRDFNPRQLIGRGVLQSLGDPGWEGQLHPGVQAHHDPAAAPVIARDHRAGRPFDPLAHPGLGCGHRFIINSHADAPILPAARPAEARAHPRSGAPPVVKR